MKKCLICGHVAYDNANTCPKCGEATWAREEKPVVEAPAPAPKRGPGRPRKS